MNTITIGSAICPVADRALLNSSYVAVQKIQFAAAALEQDFLRERVNALHAMMVSTQQTFAKSSVKTRVAFELLDLTHLLRLLGVVAARADWSEAQKTEQRQRLVGEARSQVGQALIKLAADAQALSASVRKAGEGPPDVSETLELTGAEMARREATQKELQSSLEKKQRAITEVSDALALFEKWELEGIFKKVLPTEADIDAVASNIKNRDLPGTAKLALKKLEEHLDLFGEARRFTNLAKKRDQLRVESQGLSNQIDANKTALENVQKSHACYQQIPQAWTHAQTWAAELSKIVGSYEAFASLDLLAKAQDPEQFAQVEALFHRMSEYIASVQYNH